MDVIRERVAGLDVHKDNVVACIRTNWGKSAQRERRSFGTTTAELSGLRYWLTAAGCQVVAKEATGVHWMPIYKILGDRNLALVVANAKHIKPVPGRKTDMNDATWIADLAAFSLIRASFVSDEDLHEARTLMRTRKQSVREQTRHVQRIQLRRSFDAANAKSALHMVSAWSCDERLVLAQIATDEKSNEIFAVYANPSAPTAAPPRPRPPIICSPNPSLPNA